MQLIKSMTYAGLGVSALILTACSSTPNPLDEKDRDQFFLKNTIVTWDLTEKEQAREDKKDAGDKDGSRAEGRSELEKKLVQAINSEFANSPSGPTAVDFEVKITNYDRVGNVMGNVIGGDNDELKGKVIVTNSETGEEIAVYEKIKGSKRTGFGLIGAVVQAATTPDIPGIMSASFAEKLKKRFGK